MEEGEDIDLALLTYKATSLSHNLQSPAELLNSRKYRTLLPTRIVPTRLQTGYRQIMDHGNQMQANLYNQHSRVLPRLQQYQKVVGQLDPDKNMWTPAKIVQCPAGEGRSYSLRTIHGGVYTRNRRFIKLDLTATLSLSSLSQTLGIVSKKCTGWGDVKGFRCRSNLTSRI